MNCATRRDASGQRSKLPDDSTKLPIWHLAEIGRSGVQGAGAGLASLCTMAVHHTYRNRPATSLQVAAKHAKLAGVGNAYTTYTQWQGTEMGTVPWQGTAGEEMGVKAHASRNNTSHRTSPTQMGRGIVENLGC